MPQVNGVFKPDMTSPRVSDNEEPAEERAKDFRPVDKGFTKEMAMAEANRCMRTNGLGFVWLTVRDHLGRSRESSSK